MSKLICAFAIVAVLSLCQAEDKLKVSLFFSSLCPYCQSFILDRLYPNYNDFADYINLELVPDQLCNEDHGKWKCTCLGDQKCLGNKYSSCAIANSSTKVALEYITCLERARVSKESFAQCASQARISYDELKSCVETKGLELLVAHSKRAEPLKVRGYPTIVFNDVLDEDANFEARANFKEYVCSVFKRTLLKYVLVKCIPNGAKPCEYVLNYFQ